MLQMGGLVVGPAPQNFLKYRQSWPAPGSIYCAACVSFDYDKEFLCIVYSSLMSTPASQESDIQDSRALAELGDNFLGNCEAVLEFGTVECTLNFLLLDARVPTVTDALSLDFEGAGLGLFKSLNRQAVLFKHQIDEYGDVSTLNSNVASGGYQIVELLMCQDGLFLVEEITSIGGGCGK